MVAYTCNFCIKETEAGEFPRVQATSCSMRVPGWPKLESETLSQKVQEKGMEGQQEGAADKIPEPQG